LFPGEEIIAFFLKPEADRREEIPPAVDVDVK
jgi:hypothetical protein